jgi:predicted MPP superfamily phosphohydrolase
MLRQFIFGSIVLATLALLYGYLGRRLGRHLGPRLRALLWAVLGLHAATVPLSFMAGDRLGMGPFAVAVATIGFVGLGAVSILVLLLPLMDLAQWIVRVVAQGLSAPADLGRRRFFGELGALGLTGGLSAVGYHQATKLAKVKRVEIALADLHPGLEGLRIVQITDLHVGALMRRSALEAIVDRVLSLKPDLVAVTGDLVDGSVAELQEHTAPLARLAAPLGVWFVTGNHEYYSGAKAWVREVERLGIPVLLNEHRMLDWRGARICLGGVTDRRAGGLLPEHATDPDGAFREAPDADLRLLLAHQPQTVFRAQELGVDLQLSGHTHGGQYFPYNLFVYLAQPFVAGLHRVGRTWLYVSRGTGFWGPPNRAGSESEITEVVLRKA